MQIKYSCPNLCQKDQDQLTYQQKPCKKKSARNKNFLQKSVTTTKKIKDYLQCFVENDKIQTYHKKYSESSTIQLCGTQNNQSFILYENQIKKISNLISVQSPTLEQSKSQKQQKINDRIRIGLRDLQAKSKLQIEKELLNSCRFKKVSQFCENLVIHSVQFSRNYQIVKIQIQLLSYKTSVCILNELGKNPLPFLLTEYQSGSYGNIYLTKVSNEDIAIKLIHLNEKETKLNSLENTSQKLQRIFKEYFFLLLFSQIKIGPQVKTIAGFDIILHEDSLMFGMQICSFLSGKRNNFKDLKESLFKMHMLNVVHRDIKPLNIMYSHTFKRQVFIDFGCSEAISESLGIRKWSRFAGTTAYCSDQMKDLFGGKSELVDLYYNDIYGFKRTMNQSEYQVDLSYPQIKKPELPIMILYLMKFCLYNSEWGKFTDLWKMAKKNYDDEDMETLETEILKFLLEVSNLNHLKHFYWSEIDQNVRQPSLFIEIKEIFKNSKPKIFIEFCQFKEKRNQFKGFLELYQTLQVSCGKFSNKQKNYKLMVASKKNIEKHIESLKNEIKIQQNNIQNENQSANISQKPKLDYIMQYSYVVANYCCLNQNKYNSSGQQKVQACSNLLKLYQIHFPGRIQNIRQIFDYKYRIQKYNPIAQFNLLYINEIVAKLPISNKQQQIYQSIYTLCILQFPITFNNNYYELLNLVFQNQWPSFYLISDTNIHQFTQDVLKFWEMETIRLVSYSKYDGFKWILGPQVQLECSKKQKKLFQIMASFKFQTEDDKKDLLLISRDMAQHLVSGIYDATEQTIQQFINRLVSLSIQKQIANQQKGKQLHFLLCRYILLYYTRSYNDPKQTIINIIRKQVLLNSRTRDELFNVMAFARIHKKHKHLFPQIKKKTKSIINCSEINLDFYSSQTLQSALIRKDFAEVTRLTENLQRHLEFTNDVTSINIVHDFSIHMLTFLNKYYLSESHHLTFQSVEMLTYCYPLINLFMQMGYDYLLANKTLSNIFFTDINSLTGENLYFQFIHLQNVKMMYLNIYQLANLWQKFKKLIKKQKLSLEIQQSQAHLKLHILLQSDLQKFDLLEFWLKFIRQNPRVKDLIKSNKKLNFQVIEFFITHSTNRKDFSNTCYIIQQFYNIVEIQDFIMKNNNLTYALKHMIFYYQFKSTTEDNQQHHDKIIQIYEHCLRQNYFDDIFIENKQLIHYTTFAMVFRNRNYSQIVNMLKRYCLLIKGKFNHAKIHQFNQSIEGFRWLKLTVYPIWVQFDPNQFARLLLQKISAFDIAQNPYLALIIRFLLTDDLPIEIFRKFIVCILKSIQHLDFYSQFVIKSNIREYVCLAFHSVKTKTLASQKQLNSQHNLIQFPKKNPESKIDQKLTWIHLNMVRDRRHLLACHSEAISYFVYKKQDLIGYKYPGFIRKRLYTKIERYCQMRQNYDNEKCSR